MSTTKRRIPRNPECPLTKKERIALCEYMDKVEWDTYKPIQKQSSAYASIKVEKYDEFEITLNLSWGVDSARWGENEYFAINREHLLTPENLIV
jgi:hypothetical protein